jgi:hypothetical protein
MDDSRLRRLVGLNANATPDEVVTEVERQLNALRGYLEDAMHLLGVVYTISPAKYRAYNALEESINLEVAWKNRPYRA